MGALQDHAGKQYGPYKVLGIVPREEWRSTSAEWLCLCDTGKTHNILGYRLRSKRKTCSICSRTGGASKYTPTYKSWSSMWDRCRNPNRPCWIRYGGAGITVDPRWVAFSNFLADMGERPDGTSLDRIDTLKGYGPDNCRWATRLQQARNTKDNRINEKTAATIKARLDNGERASDLATEYAIPRDLVAGIAKGKLWVKGNPYVAQSL